MKSKTQAFLFAAVIAFASSSTLASAPGGPADGAYACTFSVPSVGTVNQFAVITGKQDGVSVVVFPATQSSHIVTGYGVGMAVNGSFAGTSDRDRPFSLTYTANTVNGTFGYAVGSSTITVSASCTRVF
jgi:hypothetical protein